MRHIVFHFVISAVCLGTAPESSADETRELIIVAGQSNAVGFDAKPAELPKDDRDHQIMFWWRCGDPPPDKHDSTSGGKWTHLRAQDIGDPIRAGQARQYGNFADPAGGFGPEVGLGRTLLNERPDRKLAIVKTAFSGTSIQSDWDPKDPDSSRSCYQSMRNEIRAAIRAAKDNGIQLIPRAIVWVQGESDANEVGAATYAGNLSGVIAALRSDLDAPNLYALLAVNTRFQEGRNAFIPVIVEQQQKLAANDPLCVYVDTSEASIANNVHFDSEGTLMVGRQMAAALQQLGSQRSRRGSLKIVTLGDSITRGRRTGVQSAQTFAELVGAALAETGSPAEVINVGIGGERTDQALRRLESVIELAPDIVTIMYGTNDSYIDSGKTKSRLSAPSYRENLLALIGRLKSAGIVPILMTPPRWSERIENLGQSPNVTLEPYVQIVRDVAGELNVVLVDHYDRWSKAAASGVDLHDWTTDGCHPNPMGHQKIAEAMIPVIHDLAIARSKSDPSVNASSK